jgi:hypothetical protein
MPKKNSSARKKSNERRLSEQIVALKKKVRRSVARGETATGNMAVDGQYGREIQIKIGQLEAKDRKSRQQTDGEKRKRSQARLRTLVESLSERLK